LASGLLSGLDSGFETLGSSRLIGMATGDGRSRGGLVPGRGAGGITRGNAGGADGTGGVDIVVGAGGVGPGFDGAPGCPGRPGEVIGDGLDTGVVAPPVVVRVGVGAGVVDDVVPFPPCEFGLRRE
jgi:hypothetical protein